MTPAKRTKRQSAPRAPSKREISNSSVFNELPWVVQFGTLKPNPKPGRPPKQAEHLFRVVGEKIPFEALSKVKSHLKSQNLPAEGVYVAHDSMGCPRYVGRGSIFSRLASHKRAHSLELEYFSFYVVAEKKHEREIETLLIRAAGFLLEFNDRKKRNGIAPGSVNDYEPGTIFYERRYQKGAKPR